MFKPIVIIGSGNGETMLRFENPPQCVCANTPAQVPDAIAALQAALDEGRFIAHRHRGVEH